MILAQTPPPLPAHGLLIFLLQVAVLLIGAFALGRVAERFGMPAIVGELLTGVVLGPSLIGHLAPDFANWLIPPVSEQMHLLDAVGQIGVLLLVGVTGAHLDMTLLRRRAISAVLVSFFGLVIPLGLGIAVGAYMPADMRGAGIPTWVFALFLGVAMCVTAIPVIAKTLTDMRLLHRDVAQLTLASGTVDDSIGWFLLSIVSAAAGVGVTAGAVTRSVLYLVGFVMLAVVVGRPLIARIMQHAARSGPLSSIVFAVVLVILGGALTQSLGMEAIFGAFVIGILVGLPGVADQRHLAPLRTIVLSVLAPLFMATAGLRMDLTALADSSVALAAVVVLVIAIFGKFAGAYLGAKLARISHWEAVALGAGMNARGVVEVIVALTGLRLGVLTTATYTIIVLVAIVTSLMAPPLLRWAIGHLEPSEAETLRRAKHDSWAGTATVDER
ncbi:cation:proton antiporter [Actinoplanes sp. TFC3]|uniref:cation:proton antiporter n=1 Tax=Actinoplanes sp. TFC3 TaxID=1710355 RepID=UPI0008369111|nr:cation:proton antiporter [Actinoplanes sp. TFC3]